MSLGIPYLLLAIVLCSANRDVDDRPKKAGLADVSAHNALLQTASQPKARTDSNTQSNTLSNISVQYPIQYLQYLIYYTR